MNYAHPSSNLGDKMMLGTPFEQAFFIIADQDKFPNMMKNEAYQLLKDLTGQDFGYDPVTWLEYGVIEGFCLLINEDILKEFKKEWKTKGND